MQSCHVSHGEDHHFVSPLYSDVFAGRVYDRIISRYGDQLVFIDVDSIPFGKDFRVHIQQEHSGTDPRVDALVYVAALAPDTDETSQGQQSKFPRIDVFAHIEVTDGRIWLKRSGVPLFLRRPSRGGAEARLCNTGRAGAGSVRPEA